MLPGGADYSGSPRGIAISVHADGLCRVLKHFPSSAVTTILGFTELSDDGKLYNSAAVPVRAEASDRDSSPHGKCCRR